MNYPDPRVEVSKTTLTPAPPSLASERGGNVVHTGLGFPSLPGREGLGVSQGMILPRRKHRGILSIKSMV